MRHIVMSRFDIAPRLESSGRSMRLNWRSITVIAACLIVGGVIASMALRTILALIEGKI